MTTQEYEALQQLQVGGSPSNGKKAVVHENEPRMNHSEQLSFVAERLRKLHPKKKDGVIRSIQSMFQFTGGIEANEIEKLIAALQKKNFFTIALDGRISYPKG